MKIIVAGASGLIGSALVPGLRAAGHDVRVLVRRPARMAEELAWNPAGAGLDAAQVDGADAWINLAGENVAARRWSAAQRERILRSRVETTAAIVRALQKVRRKPAVLLNASAVGIYGNRGDEVVDEASAMGVGFLPEVCLAWETHAAGAAKLGVRTVVLRFGVVLAGGGGALARMLPLFRLGLGGPLGRGDQWMSWIAIDDVVGAMRHALETPALSGPVNLVSPSPVRNIEFARELGRALRRPAGLPAPAWALRLAFGQMADEALLASTRAMPRRLAESGYVFRQPALAEALRTALHRGDRL